MIDERNRRRTSFQEATSIRLADGQLWWLPEVSIDARDSVLRELVDAIAFRSNDEEAARDELALTMVLLSRNYELSPDFYPRILGFQPGDPARDELQTVIRELVMSAPLQCRVEPVPTADRKPRPTHRWGLAAASKTLLRARSRWSLRSH